MVSHLLTETCTVYRSSEVVRHGVVEGNTWASVLTDVPCRFDFKHDQRSRLEVTEEEFIGRQWGSAFLETQATVRPRDIIVFSQIPDSQFDVQFIDPILGFSGIHHLEATVSLRDNDVALS